MLNSEIVVNQLPELGIGVDFVSHGTLPGERFKRASTGFGATNASRARLRISQKAACTRLRCALCRANWKTLYRWRCNNTASIPLCVRVWIDFVMTFFSISNPRVTARARLRSVLSVTNFINRFCSWVDCSKSARNEEPSSRAAFNRGLASGDSGLQLNLEIALSGVSAKVKPFNHPLPGSKVP